MLGDWSEYKLRGNVVLNMCIDSPNQDKGTFHFQ